MNYSTLTLLEVAHRATILLTGLTTKYLSPKDRLSQSELKEQYFPTCPTCKKIKTKNPIVAKNHTEAINEILKILTSQENGIIKDKNEIAAVGHRIVHGGEYFTRPVIVNETVKKNLEKCYDIAPLHTPHHVKGILAIEELLPQVPQVTVYDTAFHQTIPKFAYLYALPYRFYQQFNIRKYGFHGVSNQYITERLSEITKIPTEKLKIINCHLGNGASVTAIKYGKSVETSMGFTPLSGLIMGSRCGDIDPSIPLHLNVKRIIKNK